MNVTMSADRTNVGIEAAREVIALAELILRYQAGASDPTVRGMAARLRDVCNTLIELVSDPDVRTEALFERVMGYPMDEAEHL